MTKRFNSVAPWLALVLAVVFGPAPASASTLSTEIGVGQSNSEFQIQGASFVSVDISALGVRDPALCAFCNSIYNANYTVSFYGPAGTLLSSQNAINYLYYNMYSNSHGIGAGPVNFLAPTGATVLDIVSNLSISGLLLNGHPLDFGTLSIISDGSITAATPIPASAVLFAPALVLLCLLSWLGTRKARSAKLATA